MSVFFIVVCVSVLALIGANLAPGTDRDQMFWSTFINVPNPELNWICILTMLLQYVAGPFIGFSYYATFDRLQFRQVRILMFVILFAIICIQSYHFFPLASLLIACFFEVSEGCVRDCSVCVVSLKEKIMQFVLYSSAFYTYVGAIFLAVKPSIVNSKLQNRSFYIYSLFIVSFVLSEIFRRYSWAEWCIHQGFH